MKMKSIVIIATVAISAGWLPPFLGQHASGMATAVVAEEIWLTEFEAVCAESNNAMSLSPDKLKGFIARLDKLVPVVEKLDESTRKVYLKRIRSCRNLYVFVLESKDAHPPLPQ